MLATIRQYKAAAVQAEPGWFDLEKSVQKTVTLIDEAGKEGCKLIAFPETCKFFCTTAFCLKYSNNIQGFLGNLMSLSSPPL
jgi:predicted amidohydrolase